MSVRTDVRDAVIALLNTDRPTAIPEATKRRFVPGRKFSGPLIAVFFNDEEVQRPPNDSFPARKRSLVIATQCVIGVEDPADADDAAEDLLVHIVGKLGPEDTALRQEGVTRAIELRTRWEAGPGDAGLYLLAATTHWMLEFQTLRGDLTRAQ